MHDPSASLRHHGLPLCLEHCQQAFGRPTALAGLCCTPCCHQTAAVCADRQRGLSRKHASQDPPMKVIDLLTSPCSAALVPRGSGEGLIHSFTGPHVSTTYICHAASAQPSLVQSHAIKSISAPYFLNTSCHAGKPESLSKACCYQQRSVGNVSLPGLSMLVGFNWKSAATEEDCINRRGHRESGDTAAQLRTVPGETRAPS